MKSLLKQVCSTTLFCCTLSVSAQSTVWTGSWAAAPMESPAAEVKIADQGITFRNFVHLSIGGNAVRLRLSNEYGRKSLLVAEVHVANSSRPGTIAAGSDHLVTFGGAHSVDIPAGAVALSDPVSLPVPAFADLVVSIHVAAQVDAVLTYHQAAISTNYFAAGNQASSPTLHEPTTTANWYLLTGIDVDAGPKAVTAVMLGASVVNGTHSTDDQNRRWPDDLARRLHASAATAQIGVLNEGIGGNRILHDGSGLSGFARLNRDVLSQSNATTLVFAMGTNDIGRTFFHVDPNERGVTAEQMEWAVQQVVWHAHARGMRVICATLNPYEGANYYTPEGEKIRQVFNQFILSSHVCDGTVDFDHATADPSHPARFLPRYDSGDHLHPNDAGYQAMADAFSLNSFKR
jgi:lysophospholipase L1-like esterase